MSVKIVLNHFYVWQKVTFENSILEIYDLLFEFEHQQQVLVRDIQPYELWSHPPFTLKPSFWDKWIHLWSFIEICP